MPNYINSIRFINSIQENTMTKSAITIRSRFTNFLMLALMSFAFLAVSAPASAEVVDGGTFTKKKYAISGGWEIIKEGGQTIIRFDNSFKTKQGPDLKVFLSKKSISEVNGRNATQDSVMISVLSANSGTQDYVLPADINIEDFSTILIHCEAYSVLWGGAAILNPS